MDYRIIPSPDLFHRKKVEQAIKDNGGYCCCALEKTEDTKCICTDFSEQQHSGFCHCGRYYKVAQPKVITLCGSTKFKDEFMRIQKELTLEGYLVISVGCFGHSGDNEVWTEGTKEMLDEIHKAKIYLADEIFVINVNGYIGESTRSEIEWAETLGKKVNYLEPVDKGGTNEDLFSRTYLF